jgi:large subunit ribosomal protein L15
MTHNKRKKTSRLRGSWTHGWGEKKKHRGAGSRGGRGNAGSGKRSDVKKPTFQKEKRVFGRNGFYNPTTKGTISAINVGYFDSANLNGKKGVEFKKDAITIDLSVLGYAKLLGSGVVTGKYVVTAKYATAKAISKIEAAGGSVEIVEAAAPKASKKPAKKAAPKAKTTEKVVEEATEIAEEAIEVAKEAEEVLVEAVEAVEEAVEVVEEAVKTEKKE